MGTSVNGPEDPNVVFDGDAWERVDWRGCEERVRRLRGRIFKAARDGNLAEVRDLQKLLLRSWSNTLVSVRQVTQRNKGRGTAGVDGLVALTSLLTIHRRIVPLTHTLFCTSAPPPDRLKS